jgi:hypothetical protein
MRLRDKTISFVCIILAVGLFISAGLQLDSINAKRKEMKLVSNEPLKNAPPALAFATVAMGAFRGLVVDVLWLRADRLKDEGLFFDAKQIAEWITTLQPRFTAVWEFQAWNMAYNISVAIPETQPEQRWQWVKNGYELLRDEGIQINPNSIGLYRELARIFQHKIGSVSDEAHKYYKLQLANSISPLLGDADDDFYTALAKTPDSWQQLIDKDPNVTPFVADLAAADPAFEEQKFFVNSYIALRQNPEKFKPKAFEVIEKYRGSKTLKNFDLFAKAYALRDIWKLDPAVMQQLNLMHGPRNFNDPNQILPLDWRHPDVHAIYWASLGLKKAHKEKHTIDETNTDRIVAHSLQALYRQGKMFIYDSKVPQDIQDPNRLTQAQNAIYLRPDLRMFEPYNNAVLNIIKKYTDGKKGTHHSMEIGHRNMLTNAVFSFYQSGHVRYAQHIYNQLRKLYPGDDFKPPLEVFAKKRFNEELANITINDATEMIQMELHESYFRYAMRDDDQASALESLAQQTHNYYMKKYRDENRINLPDIKMMRFFALIDFLNDQQYPVSLRQSLIERIKIERPKLADQLAEQQQILIDQQEKEKNKGGAPVE